MKRIGSPARRKPDPATADAYRAVAARLCCDADETLYGTAMTPEREEIIDRINRYLAGTSTAKLIAFLPVLARHCDNPEYGINRTDPPGHLRIVKPSGGKGA